MGEWVAITIASMLLLFILKVNAVYLQDANTPQIQQESVIN